MNEKHLHIVTHDVPYPADYGGVFDLFWKIKALHQKGVQIHLHCFTQGRPPQDELNRYCFSVQYYPRKKNISRFSLKLPFIVNSRVDQNLLSNLENDRHPVLLEGIHCTYYLNKGQLKNRKVVVRLHNAEFVYYRELARLEKNIFKKLYYSIESRLLKKIEQEIASTACLLAVSRTDEELYKKVFDAKDIHYLPVFIPFNKSAGMQGKGCYCLYHGNLSVNENEKAAEWLVKEVFSSLGLPLVIAGKDPSAALEKLIHSHQNCCLVANPSEAELQDLVGKAHINVLPSFNSTGIKLKLLYALAYGRHCLVNEAAAAGSGLSTYCHIEGDEAAFSARSKTLYEQEFSADELEKRNQLWQQEFNNELNAEKLMQFLY